MFGALKRAYANFRGFDLTHSAVPPMEGPLRPNTLLDTAPTALTLPGVDNLVRHGDAMMCTSGTDLLTLSRNPPAEGHGLSLSVVAKSSYPKEISCLASHGGNALAVGLDGAGILLVGGRHDGKEIFSLGGDPFICPTSAVFLGPDTLAVTSGSSVYCSADWKRDLMGQGQSGSVWVIDLSRTDPAGATRIANGLSFPSGIALRRDGGLYLSEAWRHRIVAISRDGKDSRVVLEDLPAYPGRIEVATGGFWLALFAPRNPMVEFVLLEKEYRLRMIETIAPEHWIAPNLAPSTSYLSPIQGGARKMLNRLKPWSPTWSYGLACFCDEAMRPLHSLHSRADGHVHGITALCPWGETLLAAAKGSGVIVAIQSAEAKGSAA